MRSIQRGIAYKVVHNASILTAVGCCGLQLYQFGQTVSIPLWEEGFRPTSFLEKIEQNRRVGLHTLCLLDIKMKEQSVENLVKNRAVFEAPRFMTCEQACQQIMQAVDEASAAEPCESDSFARLHRDSVCVGLARLGSDDQCVVASSLVGMATSKTRLSTTPPLHSLVFPGRCHSIETEMLIALTLNQQQVANADQVGDGVVNHMGDTEMKLRSLFERHNEIWASKNN